MKCPDVLPETVLVVSDLSVTPEIYIQTEIQWKEQ